MKYVRGETKCWSIPVFRCENEGCTFGYTRVLPEEITPHKHYCTDVIQKVVDGELTPECLDTEDYPCEKTMERWKDWIAGNVNNVNGVLKSIGSGLSEFGMELLNSEVSLMDKLREDGEEWLSILNRITWNFGMPFLNARQLTALSTDLGFVPPSDTVSFSRKEENSSYGKENTHRLAGNRSTQAFSDHSEADRSDDGSLQKSRAP